MGKETNKDKDNLYFVKLTIDLAFKFVFGEPKNIELLKSLLCDITKLPIEKLDDLGFMGEELHRDSMTDRKVIVDVRATLKDKTQVEVEMQIQNYHDMGKRSLYTWAKMYSSQLNRSDAFIDLAKCICINITAFDFTHEVDGHSKYVIKNDKTNERFINDLEIYFVELPKRKQVGDTRLQKWMALLSSKSWEEMKRNAEEDEIMEQVYEQAREIAMNESRRIEIERRELFLIGQNSLEKYGREQGREEERIEIAKNAIQENLPVELISKLTGLTKEEITVLKRN